MGALADLYVILSVQTGEFTAGLEEAAAAGEDFTEKFTAGTTEASDAAKELGDTATESFGAAGTAADELAASQARIVESAGAASDGEKALSDMERLEAEMAADAAVQQKALNDAHWASVDATLASARAQGTLKEAEIASGDAAETSAGKQDEAGAAADGAGSHFKLMGLAALAGTAVAVKMAGDYQQSMTRLVTSAGETQKNLGMVSQGILQMSVATNTSTKQLASGMYYVESAGFHGAQGLTVLKAAAEGAQAEGADLSTVANAVTSGLNAYGLGASHATAFTNEMVTAVAHGKMTMQDLADSISTVLPAAAKAGLNFAQVGGAISTMTAQGMSARQATLDLRHTILSLQTPTQVQVTEMQQLGINSNSLAKNIGKNGLTGTIQELEESVLKGMGPAGMVLLKSFNQSKLAAQSAQEEIKAMPSALQATARAYEQGKISAAQWQQIVYKGSESAVNKNLLQQFATTENAAKGFNTQLKAGGGDAQTFTAAMSKMMGGTTGLQTALMVGGGHMATFKANTDAVAAAGSHAGKNVQNWALIQHNFNFQLGQAGKSLEAVAISFGQALLPAATAVMHVLATVGGFLARNAIACKALAVVVGILLAGALEHGLAKALKLATGGLGDMVSKGQSVIGFFRAGEDGVSGFSKALGKVRSALQAVGLVSKETAETEAEWAAYSADAEETAAEESSSSWVAAAASTVAGWVAAGAKMVAQAAVWAVQNAIKVASVVAENVAAAATTAAAWIVANGAMLLGIGLVVAAVVVAVVEIVKHWSEISAGAVAAWHAIDNGLIHPLEHGIGDLVNWIKSHWKLLATILATVLLGPIGGLIAYVATHWQQFRSLTSRLVTDVTTFFRRLPGEILHALASLPGDMLSLGKNIVEGLIHGIESMAGDALHAAEGIGHDILSGVKGLLGIHSPSTAMATVGTQTVQGLADGIKAASAQGEQAMSQVAFQVKRAATTDLPGHPEGSQSAANVMNGLMDSATDARAKAARLADWIKESLARGMPANSQGIMSARAVITGLDSQAGSAETSASRLAVRMHTPLGMPLRNSLQSAGLDAARGLINGIEDMAGDAVSAAKGIGSDIVSGLKGMLGISSPSKVTREIGIQVADGLIQGLTGTASQVKSAASKLATDVKDALSDNLISQGGAVSLTDYIQRDNTRLQSLANKRTAILKEIATAKKYATTTATAEEQQYGVVNAAGGGTAAATPASILATLQTDLTQIRQFKANIAKLSKMGLNKAYINQIIQAGPVAGGQIAQELASGSWSQIQQINTVEKQITSASTSLGKTAADAMYDSGKDAGKGFLSGLKAQEKSIKDIMRKIAQTMVSTIRSELGIHSPSTVMRQHGRDAAAGFALGIEDGITGTAAASKRLAAAMTTGAAGGGVNAGGTMIHIEPHITVQGFIGDQAQLVAKLMPPLQEAVLEVNRRNPGTGNGLTLGTAAGRAA